MRRIVVIVHFLLLVLSSINAQIVKADHVVNFVDREDQDKPQEKLQERKTTAKAVPDGDHADTDDHQKAEHHEGPADDSCSVKQFLISGKQSFLRLLRCRRKELLVLDKCNRSKHHQCDRNAKDNCKKYC